MADYNTYPRTGEPARPNERVRDTTVVRSSNSNGAIAAIVLFIVLAIAAFAYWSADDAQVRTTADPAPAITEQVAPNPDAAQPVPAPDAPAEIAPAAPEATAPALEGAAPAPAVNP